MASVHCFLIKYLAEPQPRIDRFEQHRLLSKERLQFDDRFVDVTCVQQLDAQGVVGSRRTWKRQAEMGDCLVVATSANQLSGEYVMTEAGRPPLNVEAGQIER